MVRPPDLVAVPGNHAIKVPAGEAWVLWNPRVATHYFPGGAWVQAKSDRQKLT
jgi:hypothetical protein